MTSFSFVRSLARLITGLFTTHCKQHNATGISADHFLNYYNRCHHNTSTSNIVVRGVDREIRTVTAAGVDAICSSSHHMHLPIMLVFMVWTQRLVRRELALTQLMAHALASFHFLVVGSKQ